MNNSLNNTIPNSSGPGEQLDFKNRYIESKWFDSKHKVNIDSNLLTRAIFENCFNSFILKVIQQLQNDQIILINLKFEIIEVNSNSNINTDKLRTEFRSIATIQRVTKQDLNTILEVFLTYWDLTKQNYNSYFIKNMIFVFKILPIGAVSPSTGETLQTKLSIEDSLKPIKKFKYQGYDLFNTMDFTTWGECTFNEDYTSATVISSKKSSDLSKQPIIYKIDIISDNSILVKVIVNDTELFTFMDTRLDKKSADLTSFSRSIIHKDKDLTYVFDEGFKVLIKIKRKTYFIKPSRQDVKIENNFITMDLETRNLEGILQPYCVSIYDGQEYKSFYLTDYSNHIEMLEESILYLLQEKYNRYIVYIHNFSYFDGIFMLGIISKVAPSVSPVIKDNQLINIKIEFGNKRWFRNINNELVTKYSYSITFRDSFLLLPSSLSNLAKSFNVEDKGIFPYYLVDNEFTSLNYIGPVPAFKYFDEKVTFDHYELYKSKYKNNQWDLKQETIKYCELDCKILHDVITEFNFLIFSLFKVNVGKKTTLSSLALYIYKSKFLREQKFYIPKLGGTIYKEIKQSYTGGSVDVYKPYGKNIYIYDVNSLYPSIMKNKAMPMGKAYYFEGDILKHNHILNKKDNKPFGFFFVEIEAPKNIKIPLLQRKMKSNNSFSTIAPLGKWEGMYFSEELYNAQRYGYKFKILNGYLFSSGNLFYDYVKTLYKWKEESKKGTASYLISKLLLNSLYGKFGMNPVMKTHKIVNNYETYQYEVDKEQTEIVSLIGDKCLVSYYEPSNTEQENDAVYKDVSISVASAVTAYSRIEINRLRYLALSLGINVLYSDTDSLATDKPLPDYLIGTELGKLKLEHVYREAVFLTPKVYGGITQNGEEIIKVKGLKEDLSYLELKSLLQENTQVTKEQEKWYRRIEDGEIEIKSQIYTLMTTDNKRNLVYKNGVFIDTMPMIIEGDKILSENIHIDNRKSITKYHIDDRKSIVPYGTALSVFNNNNNENN